MSIACPSRDPGHEHALRRPPGDERRPVERERESDGGERRTDGGDQGSDLAADAASERRDAEHDVSRGETDHPGRGPVAVPRVVEHRPTAAGRGGGVR